MPSIETLEKFITVVESNKHDEAIELFYTEDSSMQENLSPPRIGRDLHLTNERLVLRRAKSLSSKCIRPVFVNGDHVVIRWVFHFDWKDGTSTDMEELTYQLWEGEKIKQEQFFYDPAQRIPKTNS
ncbi:nuclear transport factor 2 family protein [Leptospira sarikeiensis]|uniref:Nuclear transport factor 2 family protein n=1 Tax=Leptospira sarikeiensis TaxID=2484943 RepID=A0A4R9KBS9_9LEPT|nr:nuclear transport factor 2 family protein [Leptospira sarikeiensis]TGL64228.1 nuclear transport factor 2 family protein [Leptospira sarikeiensis]